MFECNCYLAKLKFWQGNSGNFQVFGAAVNPRCWSAVDVGQWSIETPIYWHTSAAYLFKFFKVN